MVICAFMGRPWYEGGLAGGKGDPGGPFIPLIEVRGWFRDPGGGGSGPGRGEGSPDGWCMSVMGSRGPGEFEGDPARVKEDEDGPGECEEGGTKYRNSEPCSYQ